MTLHGVEIVPLLNGAVRVLIWWAGALLAGYRRRGTLTLGFGLAGLVAGSRTLIETGVLPLEWLTYVSYCTTPVAGLIVASFIAHQPKGAPRPARWTP